MIYTDISGYMVRFRVQVATYWVCRMLVTVIVVRVRGWVLLLGTWPIRVSLCLFFCFEQ